MPTCPKCSYSFEKESELPDIPGETWFQGFKRGAKHGARKTSKDRKGLALGIGLGTVGLFVGGPIGAAVGLGLSTSVTDAALGRLHECPKCSHVFRSRS
jgi:hypothetical protein